MCTRVYRKENTKDYKGNRWCRFFSLILEFLSCFVNIKVHFVAFPSVLNIE